MLRFATCRCFARARQRSIHDVYHEIQLYFDSYRPYRGWPRVFLLFPRKEKVRYAGLPHAGRKAEYNNSDIRNACRRHCDRFQHLSGIYRPATWRIVLFQSKASIRKGISS